MKAARRHYVDGPLCIIGLQYLRKTISKAWRAVP